MTGLQHGYGNVIQTFYIRLSVAATP